MGDGFDNMQFVDMYMPESGKPVVLFITLIGNQPTARTGLEKRMRSIGVQIGFLIGPNSL